MKILTILLLFFCYPIKETIIEKEQYISVFYGSNTLINMVDDKVILSIKEIKEYNKEIMKKTNFMYEISEITKISKEEIKDYIKSYKMPSSPKYNGSEKITSGMINDILENRNIENIEDKEIIEKGIIVKRSNLKSFPTDIHFYSRQGIEAFDNLQETELVVNTPVLILHQSKDKQWNLVMSKNYVGWVKVDDIAYATDGDWDYFMENNDFGVIIISSIDINNTVLDMGVTLPYIGDDKFILPVKGSDDFVDRKIISIKEENIHIGYLPYTKRNVLIEAFKYEGISYSWGGMNRNVDCSSFISNVYKTFGFEFPRNTSIQKDSIGNTIFLEGKAIKEKLEILSNSTYPSLLYKPGHVMLYIGIRENNYYIIHASGKEMKVIVKNLLDEPSYLSDIDRVVTIE